METQTPAEANAAVVRRALDAISRGDLPALAGTVTPDYARVDLAQAFALDAPGVDTLVDFIAAVRRAVPDFTMTVVDMFCTEDRAAAEIRFAGTHTGELLGIPGKGGRVDVKGVSLYRFRDGLICENKQLLDVAGLVRQLQAPVPQAEAVPA